MTFDIISIFPDIFASYFNEGMLKRALDKKIITVRAYDLRAEASDRRRTVDDKPYGGGAGMVLMAEPITSAIAKIKSKIPVRSAFSTADAGGQNPKSKIMPTADHPQDDNIKAPKIKTVLLSAKGKTWTQQMARRYAKLDNVIFICGRYEGVDERVAKFVDEEISIGDYVLTGGELGALVIIDSVTRLLPEVLGNDQSALRESHSAAGVLEHPQYTRPEILTVDGKKLRAPKILLSGNHADIEKWREKKSKKLNPKSKL